MLSIIDNELSTFIRFHQHNFAYDPLVIWDLNHRCLYASRIYLEYLGISEMTGKSFADVSEEYALLGREFRSKVTCKVLESGKPYICFFLLANRSSDDFGMHQACVFPIFDQANNLIAYCSRPFQLRHDIAATRMLSAISASDISNCIRQQSVTEREKIVVFLLIIGLSHKEIAGILSRVYKEPVSVSSVSTMVSRQIYSKFDTSVASILIQKAIYSGMFYNIPRRLVENLPRIVFVEDYMAFCKQHGLFTDVLPSLTP